MKANEQIIVALDFATEAETFDLVDKLGAVATAYKVGLQLLTAEGPSVVRRLVGQGKTVFLDLKLHEIPNSVAGAVSAAGHLGVSMVTVHASAGSAVLRAAVEAARPFPGMKVLALTVITSMAQEDMNEVGVEGPVLEQVVRLARLAAAAGCQGIVTSAQEAATLREVLPSDFLVVTPGTQLSGEAKTDQNRTSTPAEAIALGATHLVMGRSISRSADPRMTFELTCGEVAAEMEKRR
jgi:orotidine-5'-phosphate decarboxylase